MAEVSVEDSGDGFNAVLSVIGVDLQASVTLGLAAERILLHQLIERAKARGEHLEV